MTLQFMPKQRAHVTALTVFGFGVNGAVFWAVFRHQHRTEQIRTAFQLGTNPAAEIRYLV